MTVCFLHLKLPISCCSKDRARPYLGYTVLINDRNLHCHINNVWSVWFDPSGSTVFTCTVIRSTVRRNFNCIPGYPDKTKVKHIFKHRLPRWHNKRILPHCRRHKKHCLHVPYLLYPLVCWWTLSYYVLKIIDNAAVNTEAHLSFQIVFLLFSEVYLWVELLGHVFLVFWEFSILFSTVAEPIFIPTYSIQGFPFLHILTNKCCILFDTRHSDRCEMISHCGFDLHFSDD